MKIRLLTTDSLGFCDRNAVILTAICFRKISAMARVPPHITKMSTIENIEAIAKIGG